MAKKKNKSRFAKERNDKTQSQELATDAWATGSYPASTDSTTEDKELLNQYDSQQSTLQDKIQAAIDKDKELLNQYGNPLKPQLALPAATEEPTLAPTQDTPATPPQPMTERTIEAPAQRIKEPSTSQPTESRPSPTPAPRRNPQSTTELTANLKSALMADALSLFRWWLLTAMFATFTAPTWMTLSGLSLYLLCAFGAIAFFLKYSFTGFKTTQYFS